MIQPFTHVYEAMPLAGSLQGSVDTEDPAQMEYGSGKPGPGPTWRLPLLTFVLDPEVA